MSTLFSRERIHTARKEHTYCLCARLILPGEKYTYLSGRSHEGFYAMKIHEGECPDVTDEEHEPYVAGV
jgi:hypothetical protein